MNDETCPKCGTKNLVEAPGKGYLICLECGEVIFTFNKDLTSRV